MKLISLFLLTFSFSSFSNSDLSSLIIEEIKKSIIEEYDLKDSFTLVEEKSTSRLDTNLNNFRLREQKRLGLPTDKILTGKERVELLKQRNKDNIINARNKPSTDSSWVDEKKNELANWENEKLKQLKAWEEERVKFLGRLDQYKKSLAPIEKVKKSELAKVPVIKMKKVKVQALPDVYIIEGALDLPIKDQGKRPTCASFAGIRSVEILLNQKKKYKALSEQYFYFSSKPECKNSPCANGGSWVFNGVSNSKKSSQFDIPQEKDCSYNGGAIPNNETQIPLANGCEKGFAKVDDFALVRDNEEILSHLKQNHPVIVGVKLSENFYTNKGHVFFKNSKLHGRDSHANGHALLIVGLIKLPPKLHSSEGRFCYLSANSWGSGWGRGGHACLSERWFDRFRFNMPFVALTSASSLN